MDIKNENMQERMKLTEIINSFFGCDAMYYDVNSFDLAYHLLENGVVLKDDVKEANKHVWLLVEPVLDNVGFMCSNCGCVVEDELYPYCPFCGVLMNKSFEFFDKDMISKQEKI